MRTLKFLFQAALLAWLISSCCCFGGLDDDDDWVGPGPLPHSEGGGGDV